MASVHSAREILHFLITQFSQKGVKKLAGGKETNQNERGKWKQQWVTHLALKNIALVCVSPRALRE